MKKVLLILAVSIGLTSCQDDDFTGYDLEKEPKESTKVYYAKDQNGIYTEITRQDVMSKVQVLKFKQEGNGFYNIYFKPTSQNCEMSYYFIDEDGNEILMFSEPSGINTAYENELSEDYFLVNSCN